jgi:hypothetical protein
MTKIFAKILEKAAMPLALLTLVVLLIVQNSELIGKKLLELQSTHPKLAPAVPKRATVVASKPSRPERPDGSSNATLRPRQAKSDGPALAFLPLRGERKATPEDVIHPLEEEDEFDRSFNDSFKKARSEALVASNSNATNEPSGKDAANPGERTPKGGDQPESKRGEKGKPGPLRLKSPKTSRSRDIVASEEDLAAERYYQQEVRNSTPSWTINKDPNGQFMGAIARYPNGSWIRYDRNQQVLQMEIVQPDGSRHSIGRQHFGRLGYDY